MSYVIIVLDVMMILVINYKIGEINENYQKFRHNRNVCTNNRYCEYFEVDMPTSLNLPYKLKKARFVKIVRIKKKNK